MALAVCHELVTQGFLDVPYLSTYTNAPFLVKPDGAFAKVTVGDGDEAADVSLVWDVATGRAVPHGEAQEPALEGSFEVEGEAVAPAFQLFRDHVAQYSPEWAAGITGLDARQIRAVATEFEATLRLGQRRWSTESSSRIGLWASWRTTWRSRNSASKRYGREAGTIYVTRGYEYG